LELKFVSNNKGKYQIEISKHALSARATPHAPLAIRGGRRGGAAGGRAKARDEQQQPLEYQVPGDFEVVDTLKNVVRCTTPAIREYLQALSSAEEQIALVTDGLLHQCVVRYNCYYAVLKRAVSCAAQLDCIMSLAIASLGSDGLGMCRPRFVSRHEYGGQPLLCIRQMRHPYLKPPSGGGGGGGDVIPNDIVLGLVDENGAVDELGIKVRTPPAMVLTGPNMGGKSTLLRQACIAIIMAQIGCFVPAEACTLTPADRIFTRIGANDDILDGRSTFMVELQETATILHHATPDSFVILDELGRGTATFDGTAIAHAVLQHLASVGCRLMFATHYHLLVADWKNHPAVAMFHMSCLVQSDKDPPDVTFLYRATAGICPKSYGMNVARYLEQALAILIDILLTLCPLSLSLSISLSMSMSRLLLLLLLLC
jgi:DNA mismatch repair protein MSH6